MSAKPYLSVVIPMFNEMANLNRGVLDQVADFLRTKKYKYEVIISDDGSTDGSSEFVDTFCSSHPQFVHFKNDHTGKAGAVTNGILQAKGDYRLFTDMDQSTPIEELDRLLPFVTDSGYSIAIGSRNSGDHNYPLSRLIMHEANIIFRKVAVGLIDINDTQCGFKLFNEKSAEAVFPRLKKLHKGFKTINGPAVIAGFDVELLFIANILGFKIKEVPVQWHYADSRRVSPVKDSLDAVSYLLRIRLNQLQGVYN